MAGQGYVNGNWNVASWKDPNRRNSFYHHPNSHAPDTQNPLYLGSTKFAEDAVDLRIPIPPRARVRPMRTFMKTYSNSFANEEVTGIDMVDKGIPGNPQKSSFPVHFVISNSNLKEEEERRGHIFPTEIKTCTEVGSLTKLSCQRRCSCDKKPSINGHSHELSSRVKAMIEEIQQRPKRNSTRTFTRLQRFAEACRQGCIDRVAHMLHKEIVNVNDELIDSLSGLHFACLEGEIDMVRLLVALGAKPNYRRKSDNFTPLMAATSHSAPETEELLQCVKELIKVGGKIDTVRSDGMTPLLIAVKNCHLKIVQVLLDKGADLDHTDLKGRTVFDLADGNEQMLQLLHKYQ